MFRIPKVKSPKLYLFKETVDVISEIIISNCLDNGLYEGL